MQTQATPGKLTARRRRQAGKGVARKLRQKGEIPAVVYGMKKENILLSVDPNALIAALDPDHGRNTVIDLTVEDDQGQGGTIKVMLKDYQRDALRRDLLHADFIRVSDEVDVRVEVPFRLTGRSEGVKVGGVLHQVFRTLPVVCRPSRIPPVIEIDVTPLQIGDTLHVGDLTLPEGVTVPLPETQTLVLIMAPRRAVEAAAGEEEGAAAEGEEAPATEAASGGE